MESNPRSNKATVKITGLPATSFPAKILLQRLCLLRKSERVGDIETINMTQLGRLRDHNVQFEIINS